jgi:hypothetical protein
MKLIEYEDKVALNPSTKPRKNCATYQDFNDIKEAINENANICIYPTNEELIGKIGNENLYRNKISINYSDLPTANNGVYNIDISSLNAKEVWVNYMYSNIECDLVNGDDQYKTKFPLSNAIINSSTSGLGVNYAPYTLLQVITQVFIQIFIGNDRNDFFKNANNCKLTLYLEYTKNS